MTTTLVGTPDPPEKPSYTAIAVGSSATAQPVTATAVGWNAIAGTSSTAVGRWLWPDTPA